MKYLIAFLPLIGALTASAQTKTTVDSLRHTVTVAKHLHNGQVDVHLYYWEDADLDVKMRLEFLTRRLMAINLRLDSLANEAHLNFFGRNKGAAIPVSIFNSRTPEEMEAEERYYTRMAKIAAAIVAFQTFPEVRPDTTHQRIKLTTQ